MNSQLKSNTHFRSENNKLPLKDYLIFGVYLISNICLVVLFFDGEFKLELIAMNYPIYLGSGIAVSTLITIYIIKKMNYL